VASVFICAGIHSKETLNADGFVDLQGVAALCDKHGVWPDYVIPQLTF